MFAWKHLVFIRICKACSRVLAARATLILLVFATLVTGCSGNLGVLNPGGFVAFEERKLFFDTLAIMLIVILPVIIMSLAFVYHYQISHRVRDYKPNWSHSFFLEGLWWGIPLVIIVGLAILTWKKTHELDPFHRLSPQPNPMIIQAIALPWKWLFIYPEQKIATVNYVVLPLNQPVEFWMTCDNAPMSALFIPQLGSQIYAMAGMRTKLNLIANRVGTYDGMNTQFNGDGFSDMHFTAHVVAESDMQSWVAHIQQSNKELTDEAYANLLNPSVGDQPAFYTVANPNLFDQVVMLYANSSGDVHPRNDQLKFRYNLD